MINLTKDQIDKLSVLGSGTDGTVFEYKKNKLIKIYHSALKEIDNNSPTKIYEMGNYDKRIIKSPINYFINNDEKIKLINKIALSKAIQKQQNVKKTNLPLDIVYLDNKFAGCIVKKEFGVQIHYLSLLGYKTKSLIINNIINEVKELLDNNIYHIDLSNSPYASIEQNGKIIPGHSHVLVNILNFKTKLIDLDGKSTIYTENYDHDLYQLSLYNLWHLIIEYMTATKVSDPEEFIDLVDDEYLDKMFENKMDIESTRNLVKHIKR